MASYESVDNLPKPSLMTGAGIATFQFALMGVVAFFTTTGGLKYADAADLKLALIAFAVYLWLIYVFLFRQGSGKAIVNPGLVNSDDPVVKQHFTNLNRTAENALEQCPIFLAALFTYAGLVNAHWAAYLCFAYTAILAPYPALFGKGTILFASTFPRYLIIKYMVCAVVFAALRS